MNNRSKASAKYNKNNTVQILLRLNKNTDADIMDQLTGLKSRQGYIKALIRYDRDFNILRDYYKRVDNINI